MATGLSPATVPASGSSSGGETLIKYQEFTSDVTAPSATEANAGEVVSAGAITFTAVLHRIEFFACTATTNVTYCDLWDASTNLGRIAMSDGNPARAMYGVRYLTPTAAEHTYRIMVWGSTSGVVGAGLGGVATKLPGFIRITRLA